MARSIRETLAPRDLPEPLRAIIRTRKRSVYIVIKPEGATHPIESPDWSEGSRTLTALYRAQVDPNGLPIAAPLTHEDIPEGCEGGTFPDYDRGEPVTLAGRVVVEGGLFRGKPIIPTLTMDLATAQAFGWDAGQFSPAMARKIAPTESEVVALASDHDRGEALAGAALALALADSNGPARFRENEERDGVEIAFADKPTAEVREALKGAGFRWSRRLSIWYAKRTPERIALARSIVAEANDPAPESAPLDLSEGALGLFLALANDACNWSMGAVPLDNHNLDDIDKGHLTKLKKADLLSTWTDDEPGLGFTYVEFTNTGEALAATHGIATLDRDSAKGGK